MDTEAIRLKLNCRRGLAVEELVFKDISSSPLVGTVPHGYYQDIFLGADFYTGHTIVEVPGRRRITDLSPVTAEVSAVTTELGPAIQVYGEVATPEGPIAKGLTVFENSARVDLCSTFLWEERPAGTFRTGIITLLPWAFDPHTLFYRTHNGGFQPETFALFGGEVLHPEPASALVSAHAGLGATEGVVELGDDKKGLRVSFDPRAVAAMPMILYRERAGQRLFRLLFSLGELDDTRVLPKGEEMRYGAFHARVPGLSPLRFGVTLEGISP